MRVFFPTFGAVLVLCVVLLAWALWQGQSMRGSGEELADTRLPQISQIYQVKLSGESLERELDRYLRTGDRQQFLVRQETLREELRQTLRFLEAVPGTRNETRVHAGVEELLRLSREMDGHLQEDAEGDAPEAVIAQFREARRDLNRELDRAVAATRQRAEEARSQIEAGAARAQWALGGFAASVLLALGMVSGLAWQAHRNQRRTERLSLFPERNPHPVFLLSPRAETIYANPAAHARAYEIGGMESDVDTLLPTRLRERFRKLAEEGWPRDRIRYVRAGWTFECAIYPLPDRSACHVYLRDVTEQAQAEKALERQAYEDPVTRLPNRRSLVRSLQESVAECREGEQVALLLIKPNRFRRMLAGRGHETGDELLVAMGERLRELLRHSDAWVQEDLHLARFEGAMFAICGRLGPADGLQPLVEELQKGMQEPFRLGGREHHFEFHLACTLFPEDGDGPDTLIRNAEAALSEARKQSHPEIIRFDRAMREQAEQSVAMEADLRKAATRGELSLVYQPQVSLDSEKIIGLEALIRWQRYGEWVSPGQFIPLAEDTGLIIPIGRWVVETALYQQEQWRKECGDVPVVAINISAQQFLHPDFLEDMEQVLEQTGARPEGLELEITETVAVDRIDRVIERMGKLREMGFRMALDDFGTGYSSMGHLSRFPLDQLKIDKTFVDAIGEPSRGSEILGGMIDLAGALGLHCIAEGVETREQVTAFKKLGCHRVQGFLYYRPMSVDDISELLSKPGAVSKGNS